VSPHEETLEVVIEHINGESRNRKYQSEMHEQRRSQTEDRNPFIGRHLLAHVETITKVHVDYVQILAFEVRLLDRKTVHELLVSDVVESTGGRFEERADFRLFTVQLRHVGICIFRGFRLAF
jgi:hypothetical protein